MIKITLYSLLVLTLLIGGCTSQKKSNNESENNTKKEIILSKAPDSPQFDEASLMMQDKKIKKNDAMKFAIDYSFEVKDYELGIQTTDAATRGIANSAKGQHIHFIVNNGPYSAHYMPGVSNELKEGNYVVLSFLSRSYHESVKSPNAYFIENLTVGDITPEEVDLSAPHLFYSRPKGTYKGKDTEKLMIDFYLLNTTISPSGNKVKATINDKIFMIDEWKPYYAENLPMGEIKIRLELVDNDGHLIEGPFNNVERTVTLVANETM